uniref:Uncharacterized protein n=1 Tax=Cacopsylla melanoneura TaxID=428564 RepID=A0A8D8QTZ4_9HEMI
MQHFSTNDVIRKPQVPSFDQSSFSKKPNNFVDQFLQSGPGSKTFISPVKQSQEIAAFDEPAVYSKPAYSSGGDLKQQKQLYDLQKQQEIERQQQAQLQQLQQQYYALQQQQQYSSTLQQATQTESIPASFLQQNNYNKPSPVYSGGESLQQGSFSKPVTSVYNGDSQQNSYSKPSTSSFNSVDQQNNLFVQNEQSLNSLKAGTELSNEEYQLLLEKQRLAQVKLLQKDREEYQHQSTNIVDQQRLQQQAQQQ